jgi:GAF domain-containing protein
MPDLTEVQRICGLLDRDEIGREEFLTQFTRQLALDIGCSRACVRILLDSTQSRVLRCVSMYEPAHEQLVAAPDLDGESAPDYFRALLRDGAVMAADARHDPATAGFAAAYLVPMDVYSLLDANFSVNGLMFGTFSCEQVGAPQHWTPRQLRLLRRIAARASLSLLQAVTATVDTTPGALWDSSAPNRLATMTVSFDDKNPKH